MLFYTIINPCPLIKQLSLIGCTEIYLDASEEWGWTQDSENHVAFLCNFTIICKGLSQKSC